MSLKDILIMQVPTGALKEIIKREGFDAKLNSTEDMADAVSSASPTIGWELADQFQFAGATAVNIHVMMSGIPPEWHDIEYFKDYLIQKYTGSLFGKGIRPKLTNEPKLIKARQLNGKIILAFSYLGTPKRYLDDYQIVVRSPQLLEYVVVHFSPFSVEIRASQTQNESFKQSVLKIMDIKEEVVWDKVTKLTDQQANELARRLKARLRAAKHKMTEGVYATKEVTAHTRVEDLESTEEYKKEFGDQPMKKKTLIFPYEYSFGFKDEISYVITDEGLWFRSNVGEEVIMYVLNHILDIKYNQNNESEEILDEEETGEQQLAIELEQEEITEQVSLE
ncbi:hypothetical protein [Aneurinibacillus migulanus]|uniref:Uncharacterized protein n=1 Tax=Aneurinibacillus migulanus TaxID=47500 RepID=A0A0D1Y1B5_ANEMI|nr:hypothetical protein [Aneurinibacillus migulanus]KIV60331.1 hypothetical protein TS65_00725 [Aneurinibacillus migulanus]KON90469.1 hypothetical protein AF333_28690 [Aneurinibacillus migulanus]MED0894859.1 hypothetical protein [Aneurinibacillus migulanus]MED1614390.1 hypothetical protein [Aneurinibacillus migulanus]SDJ79223.1 hypothetical protein SAMN04487909_12898 [Aneurinibacillus migulanus]